MGNGHGGRRATGTAASGQRARRQNGSPRRGGTTAGCWTRRAGRAPGRGSRDRPHPPGRAGARTGDDPVGLPADGDPLCALCSPTTMHPGARRELSLAALQGTISNDASTHDGEPNHEGSEPQGPRSALVLNPAVQTATSRRARTTPARGVGVVATEAPTGVPVSTTHAIHCGRALSPGDRNLGPGHTGCFRADRGVVTGERRASQGRTMRADIAPRERAMLPPPRRARARLASACGGRPPQRRRFVSGQTTVRRSVLSHSVCQRRSRAQGSRGGGASRRHPWESRIEMAFALRRARSVRPRTSARSRNAPGPAARGRLVRRGVR